MSLQVSLIEMLDGSSEFLGAFGKALLKTKAHTEVYKALAKTSYPLPQETVHT